jgi:hypothetical protein
MKKLFFVVLAMVAVLFTSCEKHQGEVLIRFHNTTTQDITNAYYDFDPDHQTGIGMLPAGEVTDYIPFSYFEVGDGIPMGFVRGKKGENDFTAWAGLWCGTGVTFYQLEPGKYTIEIVHPDALAGFAHMRFKD